MSHLVSDSVRFRRAHCVGADTDNEMSTDELASLLPLIARPVVEDWEEQVRALKLGWDTYNAVPITEAAIQAVKAIRVAPCPDGGLMIEVGGEVLAIGPDGIGAVK